MVNLCGLIPLATTRPVALVLVADDGAEEREKPTRIIEGIPIIALCCKRGNKSENKSHLDRRNAGDELGDRTGHADVVVAED